MHHAWDAASLCSISGMMTSLVFIEGRPRTSSILTMALYSARAFSKLASPRVMKRSYMALLRATEDLQLSRIGNLI